MLAIGTADLAIMPWPRGNATVSYLTGIRCAIKSVSWSSDNRHVLMRPEHDFPLLIALGEQGPQSVLRLHLQYISDARFSHLQAQLVGVGTTMCQLGLYHLADGGFVQLHETPSAVKSIAFNCSDTILLAACVGGEVCSNEIATGQLATLVRLDAPAIPTIVRFHPTAATLFGVGTTTGAFFVFDAHHRPLPMAPLYEIAASQSNVCRVSTFAFYPYANYPLAMVCRADGFVHLHDWRRRRLLHAHSAGEAVFDIDFSASGQLMATATTGGEVAFYDALNPRTPIYAARISTEPCPIKFSACTTPSPEIFLHHVAPLYVPRAQRILQAVRASGETVASNRLQHKDVNLEQLLTAQIQQRVLAAARSCIGIALEEMERTNAHVKREVQLQAEALAGDLHPARTYRRLFAVNELVWQADADRNHAEPKVRRSDDSDTAEADLDGIIVWDSDTSDDPPVQLEEQIVAGPVQKAQPFNQNESHFFEHLTL